MESIRWRLTLAKRPYDTTHRKCYAVLWAVLQLLISTKGTKLIIPTDLESLKWILVSCDATKVLVRLWLRLSNFDFNIIYRDGIEIQATDAILRLETKGEDYYDIHDKIPVDVIDIIENANEANKTSTYSVCLICADDKEQEPGKMMPKVQNYA